MQTSAFLSAFELLPFKALSNMYLRLLTMIPNTAVCQIVQ